jgi:hypothetical protein
MTGSLRAVLAGSIDYAGMFPPAGLSLARAIQCYRRHRNDQASWMLGRFVVPAAQLADLAAVYERERDGRLTVIVPGADSGAALLKNLDQTLTHVGKFPVAGAIDMLEFRWPAELLNNRDGSRLGNLVQAAAGQIVAARLTPMTMYFELLRQESSTGNTGLADETRANEIRAAIAALAEFNQTAKAIDCQAGFKLRCGGTGPGEIPSSAEVARVICACRDSGVFWKATAGLHHPFRHIDTAWNVPVHGFLNLLCAAVLADIHSLDERQMQAIVDEDNYQKFAFSDEALIWSGHVVATEQIAAARERSLRSFGSCSFDEPCDDLRKLGLM